MARKQDTRTVKTATKKTARTKAPAKPSAKAKAASKAPAKTAAKAASEKSAAKAPKAATNRARKPAPSAVRTAVSKATSAPANSKKALKSARAQAKALIADLPVPHLAQVPEKVTDSVKAIGNQITSWLDTDLGRTLVAELLVYVAGQLTAKAQSVGAGTRDAVVKAGAEMGAAAADAGAQVVKSGKSVSGAGTALLDAGRADAGSLVRSVAQAAVGAVGEVVADVTQKAIARRKGGGASPKKGRKSR